MGGGWVKEGIREGFIKYGVVGVELELEKGWGRRADGGAVSEGLVGRGLVVRRSRPFWRRVRWFAYGPLTASEVAVVRKL